MRLTQAQDATETRMKTQARRASTARAADTAAAALALGAAFAPEFSAPWQASQSVQSGCSCSVIWVLL